MTAIIGTEKQTTPQKEARVAVELYWRPLQSKWPKPETQKRVAGNAAFWPKDWAKSTANLVRELEKLGVREALIEVDAKPSDFRRLGSLGGLLQDAKTLSPRVLVSFHLPEVGEVQYPCDTYPKAEWNLHGIALTLERLRQVDTYGATIAGQRQQYRGFKRLGSGGAEAASGPSITPMDAAELVLRLVFPDNPTRAQLMVREVMEDAETMRLYVRKALRAVHPDVMGQGGDPDLARQVTMAKAVLDTHHAGADQEVAGV
jgi:hypothetical protein